METKVTKELKKIDAVIKKQGDSVYKNCMPGVTLMDLAQAIEQITDELVRKYPEVDPNYYFSLGGEDSSSLVAVKQWFLKLWYGAMYDKKKSIVVINCERNFGNYLKLNKKKLHCDTFCFKYSNLTEWIAEGHEIKKGKHRIDSPVSCSYYTWEEQLQKIVENIKFNFFFEEYEKTLV